MNHRHTILALAGHYAVIGAPDGKTLVPAAIWGVNALREHLRQPIRVPAPPVSQPQVAGYRPTVMPSLPPELVLYCEYRTEEITGITVYCCHYNGDWYVREIRGTGGGYYRIEEGGAEWVALQMEKEEASI